VAEERTPSKTLSEIAFASQQRVIEPTIEGRMQHFHRPTGSAGMG